jgi:hypothetical protein
MRALAFTLRARPTDLACAPLLVAATHEQKKEYLSGV